MESIKMIASRKSKKAYPVDEAEVQADDQILIMPDEICVCCGRREYIPEGYMICWQCRKRNQEEW